MKSLSRPLNNLKSEVRIELSSRDREADLNSVALAFFDNLERNEYCEYGGWGLDDKRPFGNSDVEGDLIEIVFGTLDETLRENEDVTEYVTSLYDDLGEYLKKKCVPALK